MDRTKILRFWYPRYDNKEKSTFYNLIFHNPLKYQLISVGDLEKRIEENEDIITTWRVQLHLGISHFNIGNFEIFKLKEKNLPVVDVYTSEYGHQFVNSYVNALAFFL